jgi:hypothetical protein
MAFPANIEQWRLINDYDNYEVSNGRARNNNTGRILKPGINGSGYHFVCLHKDKKLKNHKIHRLVCFAFCMNPNDYTVVDHLDRNRTNNMFNNLRWCTSSENNRNATISEKNTSGIKGVSKIKNSWRAQWCDNDHKNCSKCFSIRTHGDEQAKALAIAFRKEKEIEFGYM